MVMYYNNSVIKSKDTIINQKIFIKYNIKIIYQYIIINPQNKYGDIYKIISDK